MKIASEPMPVIPAYVKAAAPRARLPGIGPAGMRPIKLPMGGPVYRIASRGPAPVAPAAPAINPQQAAEALLRFVSARIAEHYGQHAMIANKVVWLCFDAKKLRDQIRRPGSDKTGNIIQATALASDLLGAAALLPKLEGAETLATSIHFVAKIGEQAHRGTIALTQADLAEFCAPRAGDPPMGEVMEVLESLGVSLRTATSS